MKSVTRIKQVKRFTKSIGKGYFLNMDMRFDDRCGNGHNTFSMTGEVRHPLRGMDRCGCLHEDIYRWFPEYRHMLPYHLCSTDGPMHYVANTMYLASCISVKQDKWFLYLENTCIKIVGLEEKQRMIAKHGDNCVFKDVPNPMAKERDLNAARRAAIWPDATLAQLLDKDQLMARLPSLIETFRNEIIKLGFEW